MALDTRHILAIIALVFAVLGGGAGFYPNHPPYAPVGLVVISVILLSVVALIA